VPPQPASTPLEIRQARPDELDSVGRITLEAYLADGFLTADDDYAAYLLDAGDRAAKAEVWVATADAVLVGTVTFCPPGSAYRELAQPDEGEFRMLAVAPTARGRGVARALVQRCFERCVELGLAEMVICSMDRMTSAHALYASFSFTRAPELDFSPVAGVSLLAFRAPTRRRDG
jgi:ribosomal protein S18 acetylase RimI-like enzyme